MVIKKFDHEHAELSNFGPGAAIYDRVAYRTAGHAHVAAMSLDEDARAAVQAAPSPEEAKALGHRVKVRPDWEHVKVAEMRAILESKFTRTPEIRKSLVGTGDRLLIATTTDDFWGRYRRPSQYSAVGANMLGRLLMQVRGALRDDPVHRWPRVALIGQPRRDIERPVRSWVRSELDRLAAKLRDSHETQVALTGLEIGPPTWWAQSAIAAELHTWGYQPFPGQGREWTAHQKTAHAEILERLNRLVVIAEWYENRFYADRDQLLTGDADAVIVVRDPEKRCGGTVSALRTYCPDMPVITVDIRRRKTTISRSFDPSVLSPRAA
ncbi:NADAR family protein [Nocardia sp. CNY236]|uniref:NADAR family protein n=1 Tax=Nocardia sp. CNY236 TaxID=1169152 RepID=UPI00041DD83F|nr:NADAR family protein [Nocardia sp. CNY236]